MDYIREMLPFTSILITSSSNAFSSIFCDCHSIRQLLNNNRKVKNNIQDKMKSKSEGIKTISSIVAEKMKSNNHHNQHLQQQQHQQNSNSVHHVNCHLEESPKIFIEKVKSYSKSENDKKNNKMEIISNGFNNIKSNQQNDDDDNKENGNSIYKNGIRKLEERLSIKHNFNVRNRFSNGSNRSLLRKNRIANNGSQKKNSLNSCSFDMKHEKFTSCENSTNTYVSNDDINYIDFDEERIRKLQIDSGSYFKEEFPLSPPHRPSEESTKKSRRENFIKSTSFLASPTSAVVVPETPTELSFLTSSPTLPFQKPGATSIPAPPKRKHRMHKDKMIACKEAKENAVNSSVLEMMHQDVLWHNTKNIELTNRYHIRNNSNNHLNSNNNIHFANANTLLSTLAKIPYGKQETDFNYDNNTISNDRNENLICQQNQNTRNIDADVKAKNNNVKSGCSRVNNVDRECLLEINRNEENIHQLGGNNQSSVEVAEDIITGNNENDNINYKESEYKNSTMPVTSGCHEATNSIKNVNSTENNNLTIINAKTIGNNSNYYHHYCKDNTDKTNEYTNKIMNIEYCQSKIYYKNLNIDEYGIPYKKADMNAKGQYSNDNSCYYYYYYNYSNDDNNSDDIIVCESTIVANDNNNNNNNNDINITLHTGNSMQSDSYNINNCHYNSIDNEFAFRNNFNRKQFGEEEECQEKQKEEKQDTYQNPKQNLIFNDVEMENEHSNLQDKSINSLIPENSTYTRLYSDSLYRDFDRISFSSIDNKLDKIVKTTATASVDIGNNNPKGNISSNKSKQIVQVHRNNKISKIHNRFEILNIRNSKRAQPVPQLPTGSNSTILR